MCIVADSVKDIQKTKIASFHVAYSFDDGKTLIPAQLVVYSAKVDSNTNTNAFILPVYNPGNDYRKIIPLDFSKMPDFFINVSNLYNRWFPSRSRSYGTFTNCGNTNSNMLMVHTVGDYKFSIMPSKIDFNKLDRRQLNVDTKARVAIDVHSDDYSFIIYQFYQKGKIEITPFGYICAPHDEYSMIIPTIHGHPYDTFPSIGLAYMPNIYIPCKPEFEDQADFDHEIFTLVKTFNKINMSESDLSNINELLKNIQMDYMKRKIRIYSPKSCVPNKIKITGYQDNNNLLITTTGYAFLKDLITDKTANI